jgi:hypothetical protein
MNYLLRRQAVGEFMVESHLFLPAHLRLCVPDASGRHWFDNPADLFARVVQARNADRLIVQRLADVEMRLRDAAVEFFPKILSQRVRVDRSAGAGVDDQLGDLDLLQAEA